MMARFLQHRGLAAATKPSPTAMPSEPPMKSKAIAATMTRRPSIVPRATTSASSARSWRAPPSSRRHSVSCRRETQRIGRHFWRFDAGEFAVVEGTGEAFDARRAHVMAAIGADMQIAFELAVKIICSQAGHCARDFPAPRAGRPALRMRGRTNSVIQFMRPPYHRARAARTACESALARCAGSRRTVSGGGVAIGRSAASVSIRAEATTAASATRTALGGLRGGLTPKPTAIGRSVAWRMRGMAAAQVLGRSLACR